MMKRLIFAFIILLLFSFQDKSKSAKKKELNPSVKKALITEFKEMEKADQFNRSILSLGTFDQEVIDSVNDLTTPQYISFMQSHKSELTQEQEDSLWAVQNALDLKNTNRLYEIISEYGWLNETQLDSVLDPMIFLFHTPKETIYKMRELLLTEVMAQRMDPKKYAMYYDNMNKKAFGKSQLYGTGDEFDPKSNSVLPPFIEDIEITNQERKKIGLEELKKGEYRTEK